MPRQDTVDFLAAFAVGTVLGIGATLLLQPDQSPRARVARKLKPYQKKLRKSYRNVARGVRGGTDATTGFTSDVIGTGRELLGEFRSEVSDILDQARSELKDMMKDQARDLGRATRKTRRRVGL